MKTFMIGTRIRAAASAAALALLCFAASAHAAPYDGAWKMSLVTTDGHCGVINVGLAIRGGKITSTSGKSRSTGSALPASFTARARSG